MDTKGDRELTSEGKRAESTKDPVSAQEMRSSSEGSEMAARQRKGERNVRFAKAAEPQERRARFKRRRYKCKRKISSDEEEEEVVQREKAAPKKKRRVDKEVNEKGEKLLTYAEAPDFMKPSAYACFD